MEQTRIDALLTWFNRFLETCRLRLNNLNKFFENFIPKKGLKFFKYRQFCRARRLSSNHIKKIKRKNFTPFSNYSHLTKKERSIKQQLIRQRESATQFIYEISINGRHDIQVKTN